ncbi:Nucleotide-binding universal stress protein, UspA family [Roseateles sp. YR242]|uniref:universal stress protein n=1 Tax=Roseateles sp. YR242 TaxID=1855305 RepID=UPI0008CC02BD|nr:universal stress protein [Roseateles sp. YR242]SEL87988.1 Nucleotide-binding universal stress protein, UspA family [Roseateles sp. YR242]
MFQRILIPTDGSDITSKAVDTAVQLAKHHGAKLFAISVKEPFPYSAVSEMQPTPPQEFFDAQERIAQERLSHVLTAAKLAGVEAQAHSVEALHAWEAIIEHARQVNADLLVMASHGRKGFQALLLGSETQKVLSHCEFPLLVVR